MSKETPEETYPLSKDGGWYELSDGTSVQGREKAEAAQAELDDIEAAQAEDEDDEDIENDEDDEDEDLPEAGDIDELRAELEAKEAELEAREEAIRNREADFARQNARIEAFNKSASPTLQTNDLEFGIRTTKQDEKGQRAFDPTSRTGRKLAVIFVQDFDVWTLDPKDPRMRVKDVVGGGEAVRQYILLARIKNSHTRRYRTMEIPGTRRPLGEKGFPANAIEAKHYQAMKEAEMKTGDPVSALVP
jgi:hypothetical protein